MIQLIKYECIVIDLLACWAIHSGSISSFFIYAKKKCYANGGIVSQSLLLVKCLHLLEM